MSILWLGDVCWVLSWLMFAVHTLRIRSASFAPALLPWVWSWELFSLFQMPVLPWFFQVNYTVWFILSTANVYLTQKWVTHRKKWILQFVAQSAALIIVFVFILRGIGQSGEFFHWAGGTLNVIISLFCLHYLRAQPQRRNHSVWAHGFRMLAGLLGSIGLLMQSGLVHFPVFLALRGTIHVVDLIFIWMYFRLEPKSGHPSQNHRTASLQT